MGASNSSAVTSYKSKGRVYWKIRVETPGGGALKQVNASKDRFLRYGIPITGPDGQPTESDVHALRHRINSSAKALRNRRIAEGELGLSEALKMFLRDKANRNDSHYLSQKEWVIEKFISIVGDLPIAEVDTEHVQAFEDHVRRHGAGDRNKKIAERSIHLYLTYLRSFFNHLRNKNRAIVHSPFDGFEMPSLGPREVTTIPVDDIEALVTKLLKGKKSDQHAARAVAVAFATGCRPEELPFLDSGFVNTDDRWVFVDKCPRRSRGHGRKHQPYPAVAADLFAALKERGGALVRGGGGRSLTQHTSANMVRKIKKVCPGFTWKALRRSYGTFLYLQRVDSLNIDRLLRHSQGSSVVPVSDAHYIARDFDRLREVVDEAFANLSWLTDIGC